MVQTENIYRVIIIGCGFGGIGMAVSLRRQGISNFILLEKEQSIGGVWRDNTYPGAACDVPSHLYSFSFAPNPRWSSVFSPQAEILDYLQGCVDRLDLQRHIRYGTEVHQAEFDELRGLWKVHTRDGNTLLSKVLITATGQLNRPSIPPLSGLEKFRGTWFHSARWNHRAVLKNKRVAVIGTGASAVQFVPEVAKQVTQLDLFQRSPPYLIPRPERRYTRFEQLLFENIPWLMKLYRASVYFKLESRALAFSRLSALMQPLVNAPFRRMLKQQITDTDLQARLTPEYPVGCKRILMSNEYLATIARPNLNLITDDIECIDETGILSSDGKHHPVDIIIFGTGFAATEFLAPMNIVGRRGRDLNQAWKNGAQAYLGITVPGFPNFFMVYGPNTNLGHNSIIYMLESQIAHIMRCLRRMQKEKANTIEINETVFGEFNRRIQQQLQLHVWHQCNSWYIDAAGHNSTNWPGFSLTYRWLTQLKKLQVYQCK